MFGPHSLILILLVVLLLLVATTKERFSRRLIFLSKKDTSQFLQNDPDGYHENMSVFDLRAQNAPNVQFVKQRASSSALDFTPYQKQIITRIVPIVDDFFQNQLDIPFVDGQKLADLPWVIALTRDRDYEQGYPHTREDIIFIPSGLFTPEDMNELAVTLAHEKVHVYSRLFPEEMKRWRIHNNYKPIGQLKDFYLARSNPDIDNIVYEKDGLPTVAIYNSEYPQGIFDARYAGRSEDNPAYEHPNETLAYKIDQMFKQYLNNN